MTSLKLILKALIGLEAGELENLVHLDYILNFLGNQGRQRYDRWQPTGADAEDKWN